MDEVKLFIDEKGKGKFFISENGQQIAEMVIAITGNDLTIYHTEVLKTADGKGFGKKLLEGMVNYARENKLKVTALCPYVFLQFKRHADAYLDIWKNK